MKLHLRAADHCRHPGINTKDYSAIPGEDEVVLPPGTQFVVDTITPWKHGVTNFARRSWGGRGLARARRGVDVHLRRGRAVHEDAGKARAFIFIKKKKNIHHM